MSIYANGLLWLYNDIEERGLKEQKFIEGVMSIVYKKKDKRDNSRKTGKSMPKTVE